MGILEKSHKPGWSRMPLMNSPIAKVLNEDQGYYGNN